LFVSIVAVAGASTQGDKAWTNAHLASPPCRPDVGKAMTGSFRTSCSPLSLRGAFAD
jgi:hypothetical protein